MSCSTAPGCRPNFQDWCCLDGFVCGSSWGQCYFAPTTTATPRSLPDTYTSSSSSYDNGFTVFITIVMLIWFGPLFVYLCIILLARFSRAAKLNSLTNRPYYERFVIMDACCNQTTMENSSGDASFDAAAVEMTKAFGGSADECLHHAIGLWLCGPCYACCMCFVSNDRNQKKANTLQQALHLKGFNTEVAVVSPLIPACCNSVFIGMTGRNDSQGGVIVSTTSFSVGPALLGPVATYSQQNVTPIRPDYLGPSGNVNEPPSYAQLAMAPNAPSYAPAFYSGNPNGYQRQVDEAEPVSVPMVEISPALEYA